MVDTFFGILQSLFNGLLWFWDFISKGITIGDYTINGGLLIGSTALLLVALVAGIKIIF